MKHNKEIVLQVLTSLMKRWTDEYRQYLVTTIWLLPRLVGGGRQQVQKLLLVTQEHSLYK